MSCEVSGVLSAAFFDIDEDAEPGALERRGEDLITDLRQGLHHHHPDLQITFSVDEREQTGTVTLIVAAGNPMTFAAAVTRTIADYAYEDWLVNVTGDPGGRLRAPATGHASLDRLLGVFLDRDHFDLDDGLDPDQHQSLRTLGDPQLAAGQCDLISHQLGLHLQRGGVHARTVPAVGPRADPVLHAAYDHRPVRVATDEEGAEYDTHTVLRVDDGEQHLIVDLTAAQFGYPPVRILRYADGAYTEL